MQKGIFLAIALLLSACSSNNDKKYYQLPVVADSAAVTTTPGAATFGSAEGSQGATAEGRGGLFATTASAPRQLWVSRVSVADFLAGNGLVYQTNDVQYVMANNNLWASPLEQQLQQAMVTDLSRLLPGRLVSSQQLSNNEATDTLALNVTGFHGRFDGRAIIQGEWLLTRDGQVTRHPFTFTLKQNEDGYDDLVRTLAQGWDQVSQQVAKDVLVIN